MPYDKAKVFLAKVLPWPMDNEDGWINVHWVNTQTKIWSGRACKSVDDIIHNIEWACRTNKNNVYVCMSRQQIMEEKIGKNGTPYRRAIRSIENSTHAKSIWFDLDFKGYSSATETLDAFTAFRKATHLPYPSTIVNSGGGLQIYWTFTEALLPQVWRPIAFALANAAKEHGLKADTQCTVDIARILRVPDTINYKYNPPLDVNLIHTNDFDYIFNKVEAPLKHYKIADIGLPPRPQQANLNSPLSAGIERPKARLVGLGVFRECAFLGNAIKTHGAQHRQPHWNMTALLSTFMENGRALHHLMANGHPGYERLSADAMYDRKEKEQREHNIGWPSCQTISLTPTDICNTCPHLAKGKSPLNFAGAAAPIVTQANGVHNTTLQSNIALPHSYRLTTTSHVEQEYTNEDGTVGYKPITPWPIYDAWIEEQAEKNIYHFESERSGNRIIVSTPMGVVAGNRMREVVQAKGFMLQTSEVKPYGEFTVAFIKELQHAKKNRPSTKPLGWNDDLSSFAYGGKLWGATGVLAATVPADDINYAPKGLLAPWKEASKLITDQQRPELNAILASAFGAPLFMFTGHNAILLSIYSTESGVGKSTAMKTACSVWAHPIKGMQSLNDTQNAIYNKLGKISNLPNYWDEMGTETLDNFNFLLQLTSGREKDRLNASAEAKPVHTWSTILVRASNSSMRHALTSKSNFTAAGSLRVFEFETPPRTTGTISTTKAQGIITALDQNYGQAGMVYAEFLGKNLAKIKADIEQCSALIETEVGDVQGERFWIANAACLLVGSNYANILGLCNIDEVELKDFLKSTILQMRGTQEVRDFKNSPSDVAQIIWDFISEECGVRHTLKTAEVWRGVGRPTMMTIITAPTEVPFVQIGVNDGIVRVDHSQFVRWLSKFNSPYKQQAASIVKAVQSNPGVTKSVGSIGAGLTMATPRIAVFDIDTKIVTDLKSEMTTQQQAAASANNVIAMTRP